jgi:hypothetical protein
MIVKFGSLDEFMDEIAREDEVLHAVRSSIISQGIEYDRQVYFRAGFVGRDGLLRYFEEDCGEDISGGDGQEGTDKAVTLQMQLHAFCEDKYCDMRYGWYEVG